MLTKLRRISLLLALAALLVPAPAQAPDRQRHRDGDDAQSGTLMAVGIRAQGGLMPGNVNPLFKTELAGMNPYRSDYEPAPDGNTFIVKVPIERTSPPLITVVLNWPALLQH